jgi:hypothetical protein
MEVPDTEEKVGRNANILDDDDEDDNDDDHHHCPPLMLL